MTEAPRSYPGSETAPKWLEEAFYETSVPKKNIALRKAYDEIVRLRNVAQGSPRCDRCGSSGDTYVLCSGCGAVAQGQPNLKQIEAAIDDHLGNIDATYEDSRRLCAQSILNLYAVPSPESK